MEIIAKMMETTPMPIPIQPRGDFLFLVVATIPRIIPTAPKMKLQQKRLTPEKTMERIPSVLELSFGTCAY